MLVSLPLILALTGFAQYKYSAQEISNSMHSKAEVLAGFLQKVAATFLANYDTSSLERFVENSANDKDLVFTVFYDGKGKPITKTMTEPEDTSGLVVYERGITNSQNETIGKVKVGFRQDAINSVMRRNLLLTGGGMLLCLLLVGFVVFSTTSKVSVLLSGAVEQLSRTGSKLGQAAHGISQSSGGLAASSHEQEVSVAKSMAALSQLEAMIARTATNARRSSEVAGASRDSAGQGKDVVDSMLKAIQAITHSHTQLSAQVKANNEQLREISTIISRINERTRVINDIVFQTKLLSFNASVEAARAGEHGKGFAVVAEEVGKLAAMSGKAAKEISTMLASSVQKVGTITSESERQLNTVLDQVHGRLNEGSSAANRCHEVFNLIATKVKSSYEMADDIAKANADQTSGVREIQEAMRELKAAMERNAEISNQQSGMALNLTAESSVLHRIMADLSVIIFGSGDLESVARTEPSAATPPKESSGPGQFAA